MKRKVITILLGLTMTATVTACGVSTERGNATDAEYIAELEEEVAELKAQIRELKQEGETEEKEEKEKNEENEQETWSDDTVIAFTDEKLLEEVKELTGVTERNITYGDVKDITEFGFEEEVEGKPEEEPELYKDVSTFKYFTSLTKLKVRTKNDTNLDALKNLSNLKTLSIGGENLQDISALESLERLECLKLSGCNQLIDISVLGKMNDLKEVKISSCSNISEFGEMNNIVSLNLEGCEKISSICSLNNIETLEVENCKNLTSIDLLEKATNISSLHLIKCENFENIKVLKKLPNLKELTLDNCKKITDLDTVKSLNGLKKLDINNIGDAIADIEITNFPDLESLGIEGESLINIKVHDLPKLTSLSIAYCPKMSSLGILENIPNLEYFSISHMDNLVDISEVSKLPDSVNKLFITECDSLTDISPLVDCPHVGILVVMYCHQINNGACVNQGNLSQFVNK